MLGMLFSSCLASSLATAGDDADVTASAGQDANTEVATDAAAETIDLHAAPIASTDTFAGARSLVSKKRAAVHNNNNRYTCS